MKTVIPNPSPNKPRSSVKRPQTYHLEIEKKETPFHLLLSLRTANQENLVKRIHHFIQQINTHNLWKLIRDSRLEPLWYELLIKHSKILSESKLCRHPQLPLPEKTHSFFEQLIGLYGYVTRSPQSKTPNIDEYWEPASYGNVDALKGLAQYYAQGLIKGDLPLELSQLKDVANELEEDFSSFQTVGYILLSLVLIAIGSRFIREKSAESKADGWHFLGNAIIAFYIADHLKTTPNSIAFLQNAYGVKTPEEAWQSSDSPLYLTGANSQIYPHG